MILMRKDVCFTSDELTVAQMLFDELGKLVSFKSLELANFMLKTTAFFMGVARITNGRGTEGQPIWVVEAVETL